MRLFNLASVMGLVACFVATPSWSAQSVSHGTVVHVDDGDTVVLLVGGSMQMKIRLASIDAPESSHTKKESGRIGQPFSALSAKFLAGLVKGKTVEAQCFEMDRYRREVCDIFVGGVSVNRAMVANGWAWANTAARGRYLRDNSLVGLEASAQAKRVGLWAGTHPVAPWVWRVDCWENGVCRQ